MITPHQSSQAVPAEAEQVRGPGFAVVAGSASRSPIEMMIDAATGYAEPERPRKPTKEEEELADDLAHAVLSDLRHYYPDVVKTRPTTWPTHLRNTIASKVAWLLASQNGANRNGSGRGFDANSGSCFVDPLVGHFWRPASEPPKAWMTRVFMIGGNYVATEGIWWVREDGSKGFWLKAGEQLFPCPWVEWWFPYPDMPNDQGQESPTTTN